ncbi:hypothetical protein HFP15_09730 [Amycolatopsis sp. K13G38]|uniref:Uncharacterized protein n=1 Tax=Amycolatopsis acididurans TaxID=2724524 RepID=A0ABX1J4E3_9PSEU|nr:hypothetical protein [Amycolatopsis acididurans]NKQ53161.1 hypothetical protein [Amycolatopsis acididurans]
MSTDRPGRKAAAAAAGLTAGVAAELAGTAATTGDTAHADPAPPAPAPEPAAPDQHPDGGTEGHTWHPTSENTTVTHGPDGSVGASTDTVWRPEGAPATPGADVPTIEEFEQIDVREDAFGNFIVDATERVVVHDHGHDKVYEDHQHLVVPGSGTPGGTDLDITEREHVVVHENRDGTISVDESNTLTVDTRPDAAGTGEIDVWQEEGVAFGHGQPGVGVNEQEQANIDDPFGGADTVHQDERSGSLSIVDKPAHDPAELAGPHVTVHTGAEPAPVVTPAATTPHQPPAPPQPPPEPHEQPETHHDAVEADPVPVHDHLDHAHGG